MTIDDEIKLRAAIAQKVLHSFYSQNIDCMKPERYKIAMSIADELVDNAIAKSYDLKKKGKSNEI
jgi:acyl-CoA reductase-like NAD-dependent aldehyde dehydrogenase